MPAYRPTRGMHLLEEIVGAYAWTVSITQNYYSHGITMKFVLKPPLLAIHSESTRDDYASVRSEYFQQAQRAIHELEEFGFTHIVEPEITIKPDSGSTDRITGTLEVQGTLSEVEHCK